MQYLAAYTLATLSGSEPSNSLSYLAEQTLTAILNATGKPVDAAQVKAVVEKLKGKQVHDVFIFIIKLISKGQSKVGSVGGGAAGGAAPAKGGKEDKKEEKKDDKKK